MFDLSAAQSAESPLKGSKWYLGYLRSHAAKLVTRDLLRRHYKTIHAPAHEDGDSESVRTGIVAVNRISIACLNCAQSKTKCDKQVCIKTGFINIR